MDIRRTFFRIQIGRLPDGSIDRVTVRSGKKEFTLSKEEAREKGFLRQGQI